MLLTISTTHAPATDLGFLLIKHPDKVQSFPTTGGAAHVFYPEATVERCTAALLLDVDPVELARPSRGQKSPDGFSLGRYVNDRPYAASSLLTVALGKVFRSALNGASKDRPDLVDTAIPLEIELPTLPCRGGAEVAVKVRKEAVLTTLAECGASRVLDLGCGPGALLLELLARPRFTEIVGADVSSVSLQIAERRLKFDRMPERRRARIRLIQSALTYHDDRLKGYERAWNDRREVTGPFDIIGDVHGCRSELETLLAKLGWTLLRDEAGRPVNATHPEGRQAVFLGDLVDRGPDSPGVLRLVMGISTAGTALCVPGNHEQKLLRKLRGRKVTVSHGLAETLEQLHAETPEFVETAAKWIDSLISHLRLDGGRLVVAHAGVERVVCEEKHMGSRAVVLVCRDQAAAETRFGVTDGCTGTVYTRTGRPFFTDPALTETLLGRVRAAAGAPVRRARHRLAAAGLRAAALVRQGRLPDP